MKHFFTLSTLLIALFAITGHIAAQVSGTAGRPVVSTPEKPVFYHIESAADGSVTVGTGTANYLEHLLYVADTIQAINNLKHGKLATIINEGYNADHALWQLVNEDNIIKLKNKGTGMYMKDCRFAVRETTFGFIATPFTDAPNQYRLRTTDQQSFTLAWYSGANGFYIDRWGLLAPNSQIAWYFAIAEGYMNNYNDLYTGAVKQDLADAITNANTALTNTKLGSEPGQFSQEARETLEEMIANAQIIHDEEDSVEAFQMMITEIKNAIQHYLSTAITPVISDDITERWYFLQGTRPANTYLSFIEDGANLLSKTVIPDATQMWKFVANNKGTANGFSMVNRVTGAYLNADAAFNTAVTATAVMPDNNLSFTVSDIYTNGTARFWIEHASGSTPAFRLHAGNTSILNWNGNAYDNSSWLIIDYSLALVRFLNESITNAETVLNKTEEGNGFGTYTTENRSSLATAIATAKTIAEAEAPSETALIDARATLQEEVSLYLSTINANPELLLSTNSANYRWYWIKSAATLAYVQNSVISAGDRTIGEKYTFEPKTEETTDAQLFRFELTEDKSKVKEIVNKLHNTYMAANGAIADTIDTLNDFTLIPLADGISFNIKPASLNSIHAQQTNALIVNWPGAAGTASAWTLEFAMEAPKITSSTNTVNNTNRISVKNGIINIEGIEYFETYSITGQRLPMNTILPKGVYIVRTADFSSKVMVN